MVYFWTELLVYFSAEISIYFCFAVKIPIESKILKELKKGDHAAFEKIFERYSKQLFQFSLSYLKSEEAAEDIVQEVFIKIWNNRKELKTDTSFQSYLFTIALNSVRKYFNQLSRLNELKYDILFDSSGLKPDFDDRSDYQVMLDKLQVQGLIFFHLFIG